MKNTSETIFKGMKQCGKCCKFKNANEFYRSKATKDGATSKCKMCVVEYNNEYRKTPKGKESVKRHNQKYFSSERGQQVRTFHNKNNYKKRLLRKKTLKN